MPDLTLVREWIAVVVILGVIVFVAIQIGLGICRPTTGHSIFGKDQD